MILQRLHILELRDMLLHIRFDFLSCYYFLGLKVTQEGDEMVKIAAAGG